MTTIVRITVALALLALAPLSLADRFYKWVDAQGTTHYGATPPPGNVAAEPVRTYDGTDEEAVWKPQPSTKAQPAPQTGSANPQDDAAGTAPAMSDELRERCKRLRKNLTTLTNRPIVRVKNPETGKMEVIDQQRRKQMIADARTGLEMCNSRRGR